MPPRAGAACSTISGSRAKGQYSTGDFVKHCSEHRPKLRVFALVGCRGEAKNCGTCQP